MKRYFLIVLTIVNLALDVLLDASHGSRGHVINARGSPSSKRDVPKRCFAILVQTIQRGGLQYTRTVQRLPN